MKNGISFSFRLGPSRSTVTIVNEIDTEFSGLWPYANNEPLDNEHIVE